MKKMKIIILVSSLLNFVCQHNLMAQDAQSSTVTSNQSSAQQSTPSANASKSSDDEGIYRHTRFGIRISPAYNSFNVISKTMTNDGGLAKFGGGLLMETQLTKNVAFQTGIGVDMFGGKITYSNDPSGLATAFTNRFLYNSPEETIDDYKVENRGKTGMLEYVLLSRTYRMTYITVPANLRMKTNKIGGFKYFGQIGIDFQFRWSAYANDRAQLVTTYDNPTTTLVELGAAQDLSKVKINSDVSFMNVAINTGIGIEREMGGVDLFLSFNYKFGVFSPVDKESNLTNKVYQTSPSTVEASKLKQEYRTRVFSITLGFMF